MWINKQLPHYAALIRLNKPIGILLLLWPTLWALWLSGNGQPEPLIVVIFIAGVIIMRSAGCVINDIADRHYDGHVERTRVRPLASGQVSCKEALILFVFLLAAAFFLVLLCNALTIKLAFIGAFLAIVYPFLKRVTHLPQLGLGLAFAWGVPMAFAAQTNNVPNAAWFLFLTALIWPIIYDTFYAMADKEDDIKIGVKSTAILFGKFTASIIGLLQIIFILMLVGVGVLFNLRDIYYVCVLFAAVLFIYQQYLIHQHSRQVYFNAFLNNNWVGMVIFVGILMSYYL